MKMMLWCMFGLATAAVVFELACAADKGVSSTSGASPTTSPTSGDEGTDLVVSFYKVLLQKEPPTLEQEKALFNPNQGLRARLVAAGRGTGKDPLILQFFREHKDLFLPRKMRSSDDVMVSSTFHWMQSLAQMKEHRKASDGYILVAFSDEPTAESRTLAFSMVGGKLEADEIYLDGYGKKMSLDEFLKIKVKGDPLQKDQ